VMSLYQDAVRVCIPRSVIQNQSSDIR